MVGRSRKKCQNREFDVNNKDLNQLSLSILILGKDVNFCTIIVWLCKDRRFFGLKVCIS